MPQKTLQWDIQRNNESLFVKLSGELTRDTLLPLWKQRASFLSLNGQKYLYWDLKDLARVDSAGFTLLADLLNHYHKIIPNSLINTPDSIKTLADLYDLDNWLEQFIIRN
ncbi:lipid asymmetry maintenance protein MlaB [Mannheimia varigena]|uniref:NTP binding protein (Contains STAS domain) n=1 Tax=Mannheimia varigena USDA-ARS-USMARC-1296 TaxID=1433287 RepID=W0Q7Y0_9PAST|nr:STAS domain-containing protein [Mannheimia varigena]AHG74994.1 NTP binding protein (Contains STAS domain) [Mannheimia varigena USDA-ARS-USMARC-1296]AHG77116.1 NTP binding protein (Contains STAS domain) [Mannheimia varigena USDA-ARS-USMARC-1312]AHG80221.1 NTP binding protein (Contains STAS domain) [Mannheimia varigena USDA-ARS-USMARC-1388]MDY2947933.1 STAS domain-containing protein [Mannheimia varigena]QLB17673.1 NTP binding protein (Contains STAS domain) [Mannheimia varigena]